MFISAGPPPLGGYKGFVSPSRFSRTVTGNPATLTHALKKPLSGVRVYGASGGVGDATANLGAPSPTLPYTKNGVHLAYDSGIYTVSGTATATTNQGIAAFDVLPSTTYTYMVIPADDSVLPQTYIYDATNTRTILAPGSHTIGNFTTAANTARIVVGCSAAAGTTPDYKFRIMAVEGEYTAETMPEYEPYGYKIPVLVGDKTINLYTDAPLIYGEDLRVDTTNQTAYRGTADVSALQDWEQDFELVKGDNVVSVDTEVQPSKVEWRYISSKRG